ncbi:MAG: GNVR domain-containing protein [Candidatus Neomarinimicrobiota bacterium]|nr:GNVR domain-containing protein [Candidatus Neomarinimicrobiota bacterium]
MVNLSEHERKAYELIQKHPEILNDREARAEVAAQNGMTEKTLRNRIGELRRFGLVTHEGVIDRQSNEEQRDENIFLLWSRRWFIIKNIVVMGFVSVVVSLLMPKWYSSQAVILSSGAGRFNIMSAFANLPLNEFGFSPVNEDISSFISILRSRSVKEHMVERFDLVERYGSRDVEYAMMALEGNIELQVTEEGALAIAVLDKQPEVAMEMVQGMLSQLDLINRRLSREQGKYNRQFLEERLDQTRVDLSRAEVELKLFQQETGVIDILAQVTAQLEAYGQLYSQKVAAHGGVYTQELQAYTELYAQKAATEVQLSVSRSTLSQNNPTIRQYELLLSEQERQLMTLAEQLDSELEIMLRDVDERLGSVEFTDGSTPIWITMTDFPELAMESVRLMREVEVQSKLLEILVPQYEQARMEESKNIPTVQIIDEPKVPLNKAKPKRMFIVLGTIFMATIFSIGYVLTEYRTRDLRKKLGSA